MSQMKKTMPKRKIILISSGWVGEVILLPGSFNWLEGIAKMIIGIFVFHPNIIKGTLEGFVYPILKSCFIIPKGFRLPFPLDAVCIG